MISLHNCSTAQALLFENLMQCLYGFQIQQLEYQNIAAPVTMLLLVTQSSGRCGDG